MGSDLGDGFGKAMVAGAIAVGLIAFGLGGLFALSIEWVQQHVWLVLH